jgi:hypothetical protein
MFIYVAGMYLQKICGHNVEFIDGSKSVVGGNIAHKSSTLDTLSWGQGNLGRIRRSRVEASILDLVAALQIRGLRLHLMTRAVPETFTSQVLGYDPALGNQSAGTFIRGYFQTYKFLDELTQANLLEMPEVADPSHEFSEARKQFKDTRPIVAHIRRGDYELNSSLGLLGFGYYESALRTMQERGKVSGRDVWIFSDSDSAAQELAAVLGKNSRPVRNEFHLSPAEEMLLMAEGSVHIISNSTFAWWGSALSASSELTIAPSNWFRSGSTHVALLRDSWLRLPNQWL